MKRLIHPANVVWLILVLATGLSYWVAEGRPGQLGPLRVGLLFALAAVKGWLVIDCFMGLRRAPAFWRRIMLGWLLAVCALLALIHAVTR
jgi:cytochrome c oxidase subunit IV